MFTHLMVTILLTIIAVFIIYNKKKYWQNHMLHTHILIMAVAGFSSLIMGVVLGLWIENNMALSATIAIIYGAGLGALIGKPFQLLVMLSGAAEGVMGGIMGAMTGVMLMLDHYTTMLMLVLYALFSLFLFVIAFSSENKKVSSEKAWEESAEVKSV